MAAIQDGDAAAREVRSEHDNIVDLCGAQSASATCSSPRNLCTRGNQYAGPRNSKREHPVSACAAELGLAGSLRPLPAAVFNKSLIPIIH